MGTKGPVTQQNINNGKSTFTPVEPNNSSSSSSFVLGYVLPTFQEWSRNLPYSRGYFDNRPFPNDFNPYYQYNPAFLASWAQQQYCGCDAYGNVPPNYQHDPNTTQPPFTMNHANGSGSHSSYNSENVLPPPSYYSYHHQYPYSRTPTTQNNNNINNNSNHNNNTSTQNLSNGDTTSIADDNFLDVDSSTSEDDDSFNPVIINVVGSPSISRTRKSDNGCARTTAYSSPKQDCENLLKILTGADVEQEEEKRKVATEVLCSKFAPPKISPPDEHNIQINSCIVTEGNARAAVSTNNNTIMEKQIQDHIVEKTLENSAINIEKENYGEKEQDHEMTMASGGKEKERPTSKVTLCSSDITMSIKSSESLMNAENDNNDNSKSILNILTTKDDSFHERFRSTLKDTPQEHWKKNIVNSKGKNNVESESGPHNENGSLVIVEENNNSDKLQHKKDFSLEEPMEIDGPADQHSLMDQMNDKNEKVQEGKKMGNPESQPVINGKTSIKEQKGQETKKPSAPPIFLTIKKQGSALVSTIGKHTRLPATVKQPVFTRPLKIFDPKPFMKNT